MGTLWHSSKRQNKLKWLDVVSVPSNPKNPESPVITTMTLLQWKFQIHIRAIGMKSTIGLNPILWPLTIIQAFKGSLGVGTRDLFKSYSNRQTNMGNESFILQTVKEMKKNAKKWPISFSETSRGSGGGRRDYWMVGWYTMLLTKKQLLLLVQQLLLK